MGERTNITWCDHTWNPWIGCTKCSPACDGCYAEQLMDTRYGRVAWGAPGKGVGTRVRTGADTWRDPYRWNRKAEIAGTRPFVFCASLADIFDNQVPAEWRADAFKVMRQTPQLVWLLLTKRPQNIFRLSRAAGGLPRNAAIGTTVEDQVRANINVPNLIEAAIETYPLFTFLSCEPLLGPIDLRSIVVSRRTLWNLEPHVLDAMAAKVNGKPAIGWVMTGGETDQGKHKARPWNPDWAMSLWRDCVATETPFHHKQNGEWKKSGFTNGEPGFDGEDGYIFDAPYPNYRTYMYKVGKKRAGRLLNGVEYDARPVVA